MNRKQKINAIYEKIANKELSFWCRVLIETTWLCHSCSGWYDEEYTGIVYEHCTWLWDTRTVNVSEYQIWDLITYWVFAYHDSLEESDDVDMELYSSCDWSCGYGDTNGEAKDSTYLHKIIWHPVMIGTVLSWYWTSNAQELINNWNYYDKPIEEQSDECIDYVYSLIQK